MMFPQLHIEFERWKYCKQYDIYVSSFGRLKDKDKHIITPGVKNGYLYYKGKAVHRMVIETFNPVPGYALLSVDHVDKNTRNARLSNLVWMTSTENREKANQENKENNPADEMPKPIGYVLLNDAKVEISTARKIMYNDKAIGNARSQIDKLFNQIENGAAEGKYGNYTLKKVA